MGVAQVARVLDACPALATTHQSAPSSRVLSDALPAKSSLRRAYKACVNKSRRVLFRRLGKTQRHIDDVATLNVGSLIVADLRGWYRGAAWTCPGRSSRMSASLESPQDQEVLTSLKEYKQIAFDSMSISYFLLYKLNQRSRPAKASGTSMSSSHGYFEPLALSQANRNSFRRPRTLRLNANTHVDIGLKSLYLNSNILMLSQAKFT